MVALDFFASAAAICVVVLLAKFVTHRTRGDLPNLAVLILHCSCLGLAALGLVAALVVRRPSRTGPSCTGSSGQGRSDRWRYFSQTRFGPTS